MEVGERIVRFSVVMAAHDAGATVGRAVASVLVQARHDWELVVVDDGSDDDTAGRAREAALGDTRVRVVSQPNAGAGSARNHGVEHTSGEWLVFLDADDALESGFLARVARAADADGELDVIGTNGTTVYPDGHERATYPETRALMVTLPAHIASSRLTVTSAVRRPVFDAVGGFRDTYAEDYDLWLRVLAAGYRAVRLPERLVRYDATRAAAKSRDRERELESVIDRLEALARAGGLDSPAREALDRTLPRLRDELALVPVKAQVRAGRFAGARAAFWRHRAALPGLRGLLVLALVTLSPQLYRALALRVDPSA